MMLVSNKDTAPKTYEQLNQLTLTDAQKDSVLKVVRNLADDKVQALGKEVAKLAKSSQKPGMKKFSEEALKRKLAESLKQNTTKLVQLRNDFIPAPLRQMVDKNTEVTFDADKMRLVRLSRDSWDLEVDVDKVGQAWMTPWANAKIF